MQKPLSNACKLSYAFDHVFPRKALAVRPDISLEDAVKGYTKGLELSKKCYSILSTNEELVVKKMTESGLVDFNKEEYEIRSVFS